MIRLSDVPTEGLTVQLLLLPMCRRRLSMPQDAQMDRWGTDQRIVTNANNWPRATLHELRRRGGFERAPCAWQRGCTTNRVAPLRYAKSTARDASPYHRLRVPMCIRISQPRQVAGTNHPSFSRAGLKIPN